MTVDVDRIGSLVAAAKGTADEFAAIVDGVAQLTTRSTRSRVVFDHDELQILIGRCRTFMRMVDQLKELEPLKISPAPVVAAVFSTNESDVLVLKYWACPGEQRLEYDSKAPPAEPMRRRFRDDMIKVADAGYMHPWATRGTDYWRTGNKTDTLVLENWFVLQPIENGDEVIRTLSSLTGIA